MLPELPKFGPLTVGARLGQHINALRARLYSQVLVSSPTIKITDTDKGQVIDRVAFYVVLNDAKAQKWDVACVDGGGKSVPLRTIVGKTA